jgi:uncharacterized protein (TIGR02246 family)
MRTRLLSFLAVPALLAGLAAQPAVAEPPKDKAAEEAALVKKAEAFIEAFHKGDAKAVAGFWAADGDYTDQTGKHLKGREAIQKAFEEFFAENKGMKLRINSASLHFLTPEVAVEDGVTEVIPPDGGPPSRARYTIVHVKKDGDWHLASVRDALYVSPTNYEHLRGLEWVIGDWVDDTDKGEVGRASFSWADNQNFIMSSFTTTFKSIAIDGATQWIGWDPLTKQIRSWTFGSQGGFGEGFWTKDGNKWIIKTTAVTRDGKKMAATDVITMIDADNVTWQAKDRTLDGKALPDIKEVKMKRVK